MLKNLVIARPRSYHSLKLQNKGPLRHQINFNVLLGTYCQLEKVEKKYKPLYRQLVKLAPWHGCYVASELNTEPRM